MKELKMLVWITQLGFSVAFPLAGFVLGALWLRERFSLGPWVLFLGFFLGLAGAVDGFRTSLKAMKCMAGDAKKKDGPPLVSFNDHQ